MMASGGDNWLHISLQTGGTLALCAPSGDSGLRAGEALLISGRPDGGEVCGFMEVLHRAMRGDAHTAAFVRREDLDRLIAHMAGPIATRH